jgi:hypothetical protein
LATTHGQKANQFFVQIKWNFKWNLHLLINWHRWCTFSIILSNYFFLFLVDKLQSNCYQMSTKNRFSKILLSTKYACTIFFISSVSVKKNLIVHNQRNEWSFDEKSMKFKLEPRSIINQLTSFLHIVHCPLQLFSFVSCWNTTIQLLLNVDKVQI